MKNALRKVGVVLVGVASASAAAVPAFATGGNLTAPTVDMTDFYTVATVVIGVIAGIFIVKKAIAMFRG